jgi:threonine synthase
MDPHTAVAQCVYERYVEQTGDQTKTVLLSTANPYKFATHVLNAFEQAGGDDFVNAERLHALTGTKIPTGISGLLGKLEVHMDVCRLDEMAERVILPVKNG